MKKSAKNSDWDVDDYKTDYESEEHWELRRKFMVTYKDKFPEDELVCLAQVFVNVEFMGCKYPDETMRLVGELSQEVASEFRAERASRLKRTFVKASSAAEQKAKGRRSKNIIENQNTFNITTILQNTKLTDNQNDSDDDGNQMRPSFAGASFTNTEMQKQLLNNYWGVLANDNNLNNNWGSTFYQNDSNIGKNKNINLFAGLKFGKFVLTLQEFTDRNCIAACANKCSSQYQEKERLTLEGDRICEIFLDGKIIGVGKHNVSMKISKKQAFDNALKYLKKECYSIKQKPTCEKIHVSKTNETLKVNVEISSEASKLDSNNIGYKMMQKLGWSGGALGLRNKGREDPIDLLTIKNNRKGLGHSTAKADEVDTKYFHKLLKEYAQSDDIRDLHFDVGFSKENRAQLHQIAVTKNLKSNSVGKKSNRYLVISKKNISSEEILKQVLINRNQIYTNKYEVVVPKCKREEFPNHIKFNQDENNDEAEMEATENNEEMDIN